jgi:hypothetical protein
MRVDWYQLADMAARGTGGLLFITFACLLLRMLKQCVSDPLGEVPGHETGSSGGSDAPNQAATSKGAVRTAHQGHAVRAAQHVIAIARDRSNVRSEHLLFYDFITAAARAVLDNPAVAENIGTIMPPNPQS